jgi:hypothetical protein
VSSIGLHSIERVLSDQGISTIFVSAKAILHESSVDVCMKVFSGGVVIDEADH